VSQSGAICAGLVEDTSAQGIGFSAVVSLGNKAAMSEVDVLKILANHKQTEVIVMYLEDMGDGQEFLVHQLHSLQLYFQDLQLLRNQFLEHLYLQLNLHKLHHFETL
jgi:hypothetical protein